jgi:hypothetical protein
MPEGLLVAQEEPLWRLFKILRGTKPSEYFRKSFEISGRQKSFSEKIGKNKLRA